jgi:PAS domain S-box-containing protein
MSQVRTTVLYIDDDAGLCRLVQKDFERRGYSVEIANDGANGVARMVRGGIDVVALDHSMPNQDGLETLASISALRDRPPVIYVTAMQDVRVAVAALKAGASDYVVKDAQGEFLPLLHRAIDASLQARALRRSVETVEAESRRNWQLALAIVNTIPDPFVVLEHDMTIVTANKAFLAMFGITQAHTQGQSILTLGKNEWVVPALRHVMEKALPENKPIEGFEIEDDFPSLGRRFFNLKATQIAQPGNPVHRMLLVFEDITDRKQRERDAAMLTNEVSHRIKNNLQVVIGLLSYEARWTPAAYAQGYRAMQARISAIAQLYELISQSNTGGTIAVDAYLRNIARIMSASLLGETSGIQIEVNAQAVHIHPDRAVPFGLLVNELTTNAVKHAFPDGTGRVTLSVEQDGDQIELTVADNGVGIKKTEEVKETSEKRGSDYVAIFVRQLGGTISPARSGESGTHVRVRLPFILIPPIGAKHLAA